MYDFDDEGIVSYTSQGKRDEERFSGQTRKKSFKKMSDSKVIQPWSDQSFELQGMNQKQNKELKEGKNRSRNSYKRSRASEPKPTLSSRDYGEVPNPIYRFDTEEQNIEEKIKWRMEYQFMRARRKKATEIIRIKHYGHMRSHTINPMCLLNNESQENVLQKSKNTLDVEELGRQLHKYSKKQEISNRLKTTIKFHCEKQGKQDFSLNHSDSDQANYSWATHRKNGVKKDHLKDHVEEKDINIRHRNEFNVFSLSKMNETKIKLPPNAKEQTLKPRNNWQIKKGRRQNEFKINLPKRQQSLLNGGITVNKIYKISSP